MPPGHPIILDQQAASGAGGVGVIVFFSTPIGANSFDPCKVIRIPESGNFCLRNLLSG